MEKFLDRFWPSQNDATRELRMKITKIEKQSKRDRCNIYLDGVYRFSLARRTLEDSGLQENEKLSEKQIQELKEKDPESKAFDRSLLILSYRANSSGEMRQKLSKNFEKPIIDKVICRLEKSGLLNDKEFAQHFAEDSKKGKRLVRLELQKKGIDKETIEQVIQEKDDAIELENAKKAAEKVLKKYEKEDSQTKKQKLYENLSRRGFSYDIFKKVVIEMNI